MPLDCVGFPIGHKESCHNIGLNNINLLHIHQYYKDLNALDIN